MPDGHFARLNEREANPNPHFKFISSLPGKKNSDVALEIMRALAAQFKVVCQKHGLRCTSFEEHAWNSVFAGRNWNAGEVIELVLRRPSGGFFPVSWLISVVCHELAHCFHMNHGREFQKLNALFRAEIKALQAKGYYGDGFWSKGARLFDGTIKDTNVLHDNQADYAGTLCGGAQSKKRPTSTKRRRNDVPLVKGVASTSSGRQTAVPLKPGGRNLKAFEEKPSGNRLDGNRILSAEETKRLRKAEADEKARLIAEKRAQARKKPKLFEQAPRVNVIGSSSGERKVLLGTTGKQARSKSAAAARADAAERRARESKPVIAYDPPDVDDVADDEDLFDHPIDDDEGPLFDRDDSATESEDDEGPSNALPESMDEMRARLDESRAKDGPNASGSGGKGAWREFIDLTKEDEEGDGVEAPDWVRDDDEVERVASGNSSWKGKERARRVSFSAKPIDLDSDSSDEDLSVDPCGPPAHKWRPVAPPTKSILKTSESRSRSPPGAASTSKLSSSPPRSGSGTPPLAARTSPAQAVPPQPAASSSTSPVSPTSTPPPTRPTPPSLQARPPLFSAPAPPPHLLQPLLSRAFAPPPSFNHPPPLSQARPHPPTVPRLGSGPPETVLQTQRLIEQQARLRSSTPTSSAPPEAEVDDETWSCPMCTFANSSLLPACEMCETVRPSSSSASAPVPPGPEPQRRRGMFDRPSPPPPPLPAPRAVAGEGSERGGVEVVGGWTCWSCGLEGNDGERWACSRCFEIKRRS